MALVSLPFTLTAGQPENVNNLNSNLTALVTGVNNIDAANITDGSVGLAELSTAVTDLLVPVGSLLDYGGSSDPVAGKWVLADGRSLSRSTYATLFTALGGASSPYGLPDGSTFNIPDLRGRVAVGPDNMGTAQGDAARLPDNDARGNVAGAASTTLTSAQIPAHSHTITNFSVSGTTSTNGDHYHGVTNVWQLGASGAGADYIASSIFPYAGNGQFTSTNGAHNHTVTSTGSGATDNTGSGSSHDNRQPYQVINKIIRIA
jgi:microcystin-dependent protein